MPAEEMPLFIQPPAPAGGFCLLAIVVANGELNTPPDLEQRLAKAGLIVAADGGAAHCRALDILPQLVIGDLDSLEPATRAEYEAQGVRILQHPVEKDQTDLELSLLFAKEAGAQEIQVLGGLGHRWDHSFANLLLGVHPQFASQDILFLNGGTRLFVIRGQASLDARLGERVSLLPLGGDVLGVRTRGLQFPLTGETLAFGSSRGVSNVIVAEPAEVEAAHGILLCVISPPELE